MFIDTSQHSPLPDGDANSKFLQSVDEPIRERIKNEVGG